MELIYSKTRKLVAVGDLVMLAEGRARVTHIDKPHKPSSTGRVGVKCISRTNPWEQECFPSAIGAEWINRECGVSSLLGDRHGNNGNR